MRRILLSLLFLLALSLPAHSATLFVSPEGTGSDGLTWQTAFPTIGEAIVASATGDEIWIRSATYFENLLIHKPLTLLGGFSGAETLEQKELRDPDKHISAIDGLRNGTSVITIESTEAVVEGLTIQNGLSMNGSGMEINNATVSLEGLTLERNGLKPGAHSGGGIHIKDSQCELTGCRFLQNIATGGGALSVGRSTLVLRNSYLLENAANLGGAVHISSNTSVRCDSCFFAENVALHKVPVGGQIGFGGQGGAIFLISGFMKSSTLHVRNSVFDRNTLSPIGGGSVFFGEDENVVEFENCTCIVGEDTVGFALFRNASLPKLVNSIVVGEPGEPSAPIAMDEAIVTHSLVEGGYPGEGNIDADPNFVDIENGDYHLQWGSPCIDSGTDTGVLTDFDGNPRPVCRYDMGAYEFHDLPRSDINRDGCINETDLMILSQDWGKVSGP